MTFWRLLFVSLVVLPGFAAAEDFEGLYHPDGAGGETWSCDPEFLGADGGALGIVSGRLIGVEGTCGLTKPPACGWRGAMPGVLHLRGRDSDGGIPDRAHGQRDYTHQG